MILQFALRLVFGLGLSWCLMPRAAVTAGFFRIQMLVALGLSVLGAMTAVHADAAQTLLSPQTVRALCIVLAVTAFGGSLLWSLGRRTAGTLACALLALVSTVALVASLPLGGEPLIQATYIAASELSSSWLMGGAVCAMLLGHWHLTATSMSLVPLTRLTSLLLAAAAVRGLLAATGLWTAGELSWSGVQQSWLVLRWAAGIAGPLVLSVMVLRILRYRNTQSATGVLFAAVILVFIGETTAALLYRDLHWPL